MEMKGLRSTLEQKGQETVQMKESLKLKELELQKYNQNEKKNKHKFCTRRNKN
jgi:hypothetical protein